MNSTSIRSNRRAGKIFSAICVPLLLLALSCAAAIPSAEKLLPDDTLAVFSSPDFAKLRAIYHQSPQTQFWNDPAMKPFKDKFMSQLNEKWIQPLQRDLGVNFDDFANLPQGQFTVAVVQNGWPATPGAIPAFLLLLDTKEKSNQLKTNLTALKRKWVDSGKAIKTETIRGIEFSILPVSENDAPPTLKKLFSSSDDADSGDDAETNKPAKMELIFGQYESLLIAGTSSKAVEKVTVHLTGGAMPSLGDLASFESSRLAMFRDTPLYGWVNIKSFIDMIANLKDPSSENPFALFSPKKLITALGLDGLRTFAFSAQNSDDGSTAQFFLGVPESARQGFFKILAGESKDSSPPPFVPADAVKFQRIRIDGQKAWATMEKMLTGISPQLIGGLNFLLDTAETAAKQKDPNFDIRKSLFGNLGDDMIAYEKAPQGTSLTDLKSGPALFLLGSPRPAELAAALKSVLALMNQEGGAPEEREFLGRKIYSVPLPAPPIPVGNVTGGGGRKLYYAATSSYVAISTDSAMLEEFLRNSDGQKKPLRETPGLTAAAAKIGGFNSGWFGYENQKKTTRAVFELLRKSGSDSKSPQMLAPGIPAYVPENAFKEWMDFSLLPPFDQIAKYFNFSVYSMSANPDGFMFKIFAPVPPELRN
ncbi:MAG TPA: hypothetical protein VFM25_02715 [Verrucomicrobiae bacterium]|nr:hypothetical protein [Verrucomicrobiae bacterium]